MLDLLDRVVDALIAHQYVAMAGILLLCGLGLPLPEEVTLIGSGLLVGWGDADFLYASIACIAGILAGDSVIFGLGYMFGVRFLRSRPMRFLLSSRRQRRVGRFFRKHGSKAVFFARFFAGVRIGVYAYAGSQRMSWWRFLSLDFVGALLSGPISIWIGKWAALKFAQNRQEAQRKALEIAAQAGHWILLGIAVAIGTYVLVRIYLNRRAKERRDSRRRGGAIARMEAAKRAVEGKHEGPPTRRDAALDDRQRDHRPGE